MQSGKTPWLTAGLPAVIRNHPVFGVGQEKEVLLCYIDLEPTLYQARAASHLHLYSAQ